MMTPYSLPKGFPSVDILEALGGCLSMEVCESGMVRNQHFPTKKQ